MAVCGIDYSTCAIDVVLLDEDTDAATWHRFELSGQDAFDRARDVHRAFQLTHDEWDSVVAVGIEDPRGYGAGSLYRVQGAILAGIPWNRLVYPWIPSAWRKQVGLPGNASKQDVAAHVLYARTNEAEWRGSSWVEAWPQDACDAYCIALATRQRLEIGAAA